MCLQVRQQSKEIAQDVREKVKREKSKQIANIEKEGASKLKEWQNRKLLQLQNQYEECLKDIGLGHSLATVEEVDEDEAALNSKFNRQIAKERGQKAAAILQIEKNDKNIKKAIPQQQKKIAREIENTRSAMVTNVRKSKKKSKRRKMNKTDDMVNITIDTSASDAEVPALNLSSEMDDSDEDERNKSPSSCKSRSPASKSYFVQTNNIIELINFLGHPSTCSSPRLIAPEVPTIPSLPREEFEYDDRISNHIRQRRWRRRQHEDNLLNRENFVNCDICPMESELKSKVIHHACPCDDRFNNTKPQGGPSATSKVSFQREDVVVDQIPYKPTVSLKDVKSSEQSASSRVEKVIYYDHANRYTKTLQPVDNVVRIQPENIVICPNRDEMEQYLSEAYKRDKVAETRGQIALEKGKIMRDYDEMVKQLPLLQKQKRVTSIRPNEPNLHLSEERQKERMSLRQNQIENCYNRTANLPIPSIITIPPVTRLVTNPITDECKCDDVPEIGLGTWDVIDKKESTKTNKCTESLQVMLNKLREQCDKAIGESRLLSKDSQLYKLINELENTRTEGSCGCKEKSEKGFKRSQSKSMEEGEESTNSKVKNTKSTSKIKSKRKKRNNIQTQTTPRNDSRTEDKRKVDKSTIVDCILTEEKKSEIERTKMCPCTDVPKIKETKDMEKICEIVIKIKEDNEPQIVVSPKKNEITVKTDTVNDDENCRQLQSQRDKYKNDTNKMDKDKTINNSTSTSYLSLPDFNKNFKRRTKCNVPCSSTLSKLSNGKQTNLVLSNREDSKKQLDPRLIVYIKKLLSMSNRRLENLSVSTASDPSTPSTSIVNNYVNNPIEQLSNVMKFYHLSPNDIAGVVRNDIESTNRSLGINSTNSHAVPLQDETSYLTVKTPDAKSAEDVYDYSITTYPDIMLKYAEIAENCHQRISNLAALIEKVRQEKQEILRNPNSSSGSDKENSTSYFNLPSKIRDDSMKKIDGTTNKYDNSLSESDEIMKKILEIDYNLAERLKGMSPMELNSLYDELKLNASTSTEEGGGGVKEDDVAQRLKNLLNKETVSNTDDDNTKRQGNIDLPDFEPLMLDIKELPKLPQIDTRPNNAAGSYNVDLIKRTKRPPPTRSFVTAKSNNEDIRLQHQLSTIIEADSQMSMSKQPERKNDDSPSSRISSVSKKSQSNKSDKRANVIKDTWVIDIQEPQTLSQSTESSTEDKSDLDNMEAMLRSMGMGWAVATLRKTQEALAQTSSSTSSLDINISQKELKITETSGNRSSSLDLKSFLEKQMFKKVSGSKENSSIDMTHYMREIGELTISHSCSSINTSSSGCLLNNKNQRQRTSTPIQSARSTTDKSKSKSIVKFTEESDISSVKSNVEINFFSLIDNSENSNVTADRD